MVPLFAAALIVLDPGHHPSSPGATSATGAPEYLYNEQWVARLQPALEAKGLKVARTRKVGAEMTLSARAAAANAAKATLLVSVHHDAAAAFEKVDGRQTVARGYSLHLRGDRPESVAAAVAISKALTAAGFTSAWQYHRQYYPMVEGVDPTLGLFDRRELTIPKKAKVPAVILELGFIDHLAEEAELNQPEVQARLLEAIAQGIADAVPADKKPRHGHPTAHHGAGAGGVSHPAARQP